MKYGKKIAALIITGMLFSGCGTAQNPVSTGKQPETGTVAPVPDVKNEWTEPEGELQEDVYAGYADNAPADFSKVKISCLEGTEGCYFTDGSTLTFTDVAADSVYAISGEFKGNIVIDTGDDYNFDLELHGVSFSCDSTNPVYVKTLENGETAKGNVTIAGGILNLYSNDDGLHADGAVEVKNGQTTISHCYEGIEGNTITISGGEVYVYCTGDGIDSNSRTPEDGIIFSGGDTLVISASGMNSAIDTEQGYRYEGGRVVAVMPNGGMSREAMDCRNFSAIGSKQNVNLSSGKHVGVYADNKTVVTFEMPSDLNGMVIYLGSSEASISLNGEATAETDANGVCWYK